MEQLRRFRLTQRTERHHRRRHDLVFYKMAPLRATVHSRPSPLHR